MTGLQTLTALFAIHRIYRNWGSLVRRIMTYESEKTKQRKIHEGIGHGGSFEIMIDRFSEQGDTRTNYEALTPQNIAITSD